MKVAKLFNLISLLMILGLISNSCKTINSFESPSQLKSVYDGQYSLKVKPVSDNLLGFFTCSIHSTNDAECVSAFKTITGQDVVFSYETLDQNDSLFEEYTTKVQMLSSMYQQSGSKLADVGAASSAVLLSVPTTEKTASSAVLEKLTKEKIASDWRFIGGQQSQLSGLSYTYNPRIGYYNNMTKQNMFDFAKEFRMIVLDDMKAALRNPNINNNHIEILKQLDTASSQLLSKSTAYGSPDLGGFQKLVYKITESMASVPNNVRASFFDFKTNGYGSVSTYKKSLEDYLSKQLAQHDKNISVMRSYINNVNVDSRRGNFKTASHQALEFADQSVKEGFGSQGKFFERLFSSSSEALPTDTVKNYLDDIALSHHLFPLMGINESKMSDMNWKGINDLHKTYLADPSQLKFKGTVKPVRKTMPAPSRVVDTPPTRKAPPTPPKTPPAAPTAQASTPPTRKAPPTPPKTPPAAPTAQASTPPTRKAPPTPPKTPPAAPTAQASTPPTRKAPPTPPKTPPAAPTAQASTPPTRKAPPTPPKTPPASKTAAASSAPKVNLSKPVVAESMEIINVDVVVQEKGVKAAKQFPGTPLPHLLTGSPTATNPLLPGTVPTTPHRLPGTATTATPQLPGSIPETVPMLPSARSAQQVAGSADPVLFTPNAKHILSDVSPKHFASFPTPRIYPSRLKIAGGELVHDTAINSARGIARNMVRKSGKLRSTSAILALPFVGVIGVKSLFTATIALAEEPEDLTTDGYSQASSSQYTLSSLADRESLNLLKIGMFQAIFSIDPTNKLQVQSVPDTLYALGAFLRTNTTIFPSHQSILYSYCLPSTTSNQANCYSID